MGTKTNNKEKERNKGKRGVEKGTIKEGKEKGRRRQTTNKKVEKERGERGERRKIFLRNKKYGGKET